MDAKAAAVLAKNYVKDLFADEGVMNVGLEEVEFDEGTETWRVTIGFSRPWDKPSGAMAQIAQQLSIPSRSYKVVQIHDSNAQVMSVKNRDTKS
jgi:hypothetical protein